MKFLRILLSHLPSQALRRRRQPRRPRIITPLSFLLIAAFTVNAAAQTSGIWSGDAAGNWNDSTRWSGGAIASGIGMLADFSAVNLTADRTVTVNAPFTIGFLKFADTTQSNTWTLASSSTNVLTLQTATDTPGIDVASGGTAFISARLGGTQGFTFTGGGTLRLSAGANNTITGDINLTDGGTLQFSSNSLNSATRVVFQEDATLAWQGNHTNDLSSKITLNDDVTATLNLGTAAVTFAGALQHGISGTGAVIKNGTGTLTITAQNTFTGLFRARQGRTILAGGDNRLSAAGTLAIGQGAQSGILQLGDASGASNQTTTGFSSAGNGNSGNAVVGGHTTVSTLTINIAAANTYGGQIGGAGTNENNIAIVKGGAGALTLSSTLSTFTGGVTLNQGTISFSDGALGTGGLITYAGTSGLQWAAGSTSDISSRLKINDGVTATVDTNGNNVTFASTIQTGLTGAANVTKGGGGTLTLTAANTWTGNTRINNGRIILAGGDNRLHSSTLLQLGNGGNSGVLQLGDASGASHQTITGMAVTGGGSSTGNAIVGGHSTISVLTLNSAANVVWNQALGGAGVNENNLALVKSGAGRLTLGGANTFAGNVTISGGEVLISSAGALGLGAKTLTIAGSIHAPSLRLDSISGIALASTLTLVTSNDDAAKAAIVNVGGNNVIGGTLSPTTGGYGGGNTRIVVENGSLTLNGDIAPEAGTAAVLSLILDGAANGTVNGLIASNGSRVLGVVKDGSGTWTLTAANSYSGATVINAGRLNVTTAQTGGGAISLADGATLGITLGGVGQTLAAASLDLGTSAGAALNFDLGAFSNPTTALITTTSLATAGSITVNIAGTGLSVGQFGLIDYTGSIGGSGFAGFVLGNLPARVSGVLVNNTAQTRIDLNITAFDVPKWTGAADNNWDINDGADPTTGSGTVNWRETTSGNATRYLQFNNVVDSVRFDDSATGSTDVNLTAQLAPNSITVDNTTKDYIFSGSGHLSGSTTILKQGTGSLTFLNTGLNDFSGTTTITAGAVILGNGLDYGVGQLGTGAVVNHGNLVLNRPDDFAFANLISGTGTLTKQAAGAVLLQGNNAGFDGVVVIEEGLLILGSASALGTTAGNTVVQTGGTLDVTGFAAVAEAVELAGGKVRVTSGATNKIDGGITLNGGGIVSADAGTTLTLAGAIGGTGGLAKENAGTVIITQASSYAGGTHISGGTLQFGASNGTGTAAAPVGAIDFNPVFGDTATLAIYRADSTLNISHVISSSGAGTNAIIIGVSGAASPSGMVTFSGNNTFSGNVSIVGGSLRITTSAALGSGSKAITIGNAARPGLLLDGSSGGLNLSSDLHFRISSDGAGTAAGSAAGAIVNTAGDNIVNGIISVINGGGGNGKVTAQSGTLTLNGNIDADGSTGNRTFIVGGAASGVINGIISDFNSAATSVMSFTKADAGLWTLNGDNTFTGTVTINSGTLKVASIRGSGVAQSLGMGASAISLGSADSAVLDYTGSAGTTLTRAITVGGEGGGVLKNSGGAVLTLSGTLTRAASRALTFTGGEFIVTGQITGASSVNHINGATVTFSQTTNNFVGSTAVYGGGVLKNGASQVLTDSSTLVLGDAAGNTGGTYDLNGFNETIAGISGAGTGSKIVTNSAASGTSTLTVTGTSTFDGVIQDSATAQVALTKSTGGTLTITAAQGYSGKTTVSGGTLALTGAASIAASQWVQVDAGAVLDVGGTTTAYSHSGTNGSFALSGGGTINGPVIVGGHVLLSAGTSSDAQNIATAGDGFGVLSFSSDLTLLGGARVIQPRALFQLGGATGNTGDPATIENVLAFDLITSAAVDTISVAGTLNLSSGSVLKVVFGNYTAAHGDVFNLLDWSAVNLNGFDVATDLDLPELGNPLLSWGTDQFATAGLLYITGAVPEPSRALLTFAGTAALLLRRRRSI